MFVRNYYKQFAMFCMATTGTDVTNRTCVVYSGDEKAPSSYSKCGAPAFGGLNQTNGAGSVQVVQTSFAGTASGGIIFGDGNTPPTLDDYCLSGNIIAGISTAVSPVLTDDDSGSTLKIVYSVTNNNSDSITIAEIGFFSTLASGGVTYKVLVERTVLDSPVTIPAGGVGQVTYTIRMNYPT